MQLQTCNHRLTFDSQLWPNSLSSLPIERLSSFNVEFEEGGNGFGCVLIPRLIQSCNHEAVNEHHASILVCKTKFSSTLCILKTSHLSLCSGEVEVGGRLDKLGKGYTLPFIFAPRPANKLATSGTSFLLDCFFKKRQC